MRHMLASSAFALMLAGPALADSHMTSSDMQTKGFVAHSQQTDLFGSELIGKRLYVAEIDASEASATDMETNWNDIGEISDLLLSRDGDVKAVILDIGGFLGIGEKTVAVDMSQLKIIQDKDNAGDYFVAANGSRVMLENAPQFERASIENAVLMNESETHAMPPAWERPVSAHKGYADVTATDLTAEELQGAALYGKTDEWIGEIAALELTQDGQIETVFADVGGFLGLGEHRIAIAFDELQILRADGGDDLRVYVSATQEQLERRPAVEG